MEGQQPFPFGINKDRAKEIIDLEVRTFHGQSRSEKVTIFIFTVLFVFFTMISIGLCFFGKEYLNVIC